MKSKRAKKIQTKEETINELKKEYYVNTEIHKKNKDQYKIQVQVGLIKMGLPQERMYDSVLEELKFTLKELKLKIDSKFVMNAPQFMYEATKEWRALKIEEAERNLKDAKDSISEIEKHVALVEAEIADQTARIEKRQPEIIDQLNELKADMSDIEKPAYIG